VPAEAVTTLRRTARGSVLAALALLGSLALGVPPTYGGYVATIRNSTDTAATASYFTCIGYAAGTADGASAVFAWPLDETTGTTAADVSGHAATGTYAATPTADAAATLACKRDTGAAYRLNGSSDYVRPSTGTAASAPATFSAEIWFKTTVASGRLIGFGSSRTGASTTEDRAIYLTSAGKIVFAVNPGTVKTIASSLSYTDGSWHHVVATLSSTSGSSLYVDKALVASDATMTAAGAYSGYWRVGYDSQAGLTGSGSNAFFSGSVRYAAVYSSVLTAAKIATHYVAGT
jgi:hypothetical protein